MISFEPPNIHQVPGAVWLHRERTPGCQRCSGTRGECQQQEAHGGAWSDPETRTDVPKKRICSTVSDWGGKSIGEWQYPPNIGDKFYATLRKLGYQRGAGGDYQ